MAYHLGVLTEADLAKIGKDKKFTTAFMNKHTFSEKEIKHYPYHLRREFYAQWYAGAGEDGEEPVRIYATDPAMARWWISENYVRPADEFWEVKTRTVGLNPRGRGQQAVSSSAKARRPGKPRLTR